MCHSTLLDYVSVLCALMCMLAARVSIVVQAMALCCSCGAVVCLRVFDYPYMGMLRSRIWQVLQ